MVSSLICNLRKRLWLLIAAGCLLAQPGNLGSQKIYGSYGRFYEKIPTAFTAANHVNSQNLFITFDHNPLENPSGGDTIGVSSSIAERVRGLGGQYLDEFIIGYDRLLGSQIKLGIQEIYRTLGQVVEDSFDPAQGKFVIGNPGRGELHSIPQLKRTYKALQVSVQKSAAMGLNSFASYTLSRNDGNYSGLFNQDQGGSLPKSGPVADFPDQYQNSEGLLPNDRTHVFKFWGSYRFRFGLDIGSTFVWQSGTPLNEFGATSVGFPYFSFLQQRGTVGRTPNLWDLSLRFSYALPMITTPMSTKIILDLLHIGNPTKAVDFDQVHFFAIDEAGNQIQENQDYLAPTRYQLPMTFRLGMEAGF